MKVTDHDVSRHRLELILSISIPVFSFGGIAIAIHLKNAGFIPDAGTFAWGCVIGACILGYLAYIKPRRDIVAICAPLYALLIFIVPMELTPNLLMQVLFAASITILTVRLNKYFGALNYKGGSDPMEQFLTAYIERMRPYFTGLPEATAHQLASAFLAFKFGLYANAVRECTYAISSLPDSGPQGALKKAVTIVKENAQDLYNSQVVADLSVMFSETEHQYTVVNLLPEKIEDPATLELDNALVLLYTVAYIASPDDELALDEHRKYILRLLSGYKKALGLE